MQNHGDYIGILRIISVVGSAIVVVTTHSMGRYARGAASAGFRSFRDPDLSGKNILFGENAWFGVSHLQIWEKSVEAIVPRRCTKRIRPSTERTWFCGDEITNTQHEVVLACTAVAVQRLRDLYAVRGGQILGGLQYRAGLQRAGRML